MAYIIQTSQYLYWHIYKSRANQQTTALKQVQIATQTFSRKKLVLGGSGALCGEQNSDRQCVACLWTIYF